MVKLLSPIGPYDVKLDTMNNVENNEALLKRDTTNRILTSHYSNIETAGDRATTLLDAHTNLGARRSGEKSASGRTLRPLDQRQPSNNCSMRYGQRSLQGGRFKNWGRILISKSA